MTTLFLSCCFTQNIPCPCLEVSSSSCGAMPVILEEDTNFESASRLPHCNLKAGVEVYILVVRLQRRLVHDLGPTLHNGSTTEETAITFEFSWCTTGRTYSRGGAMAYHRKGWGAEKHPWGGEVYIENRKGGSTRGQ